MEMEREGAAGDSAATGVEKDGEPECLEEDEWAGMPDLWDLGRGCQKP
jgi:hypothetical protein